MFHQIRLKSHFCYNYTISLYLTHAAGKEEQEKREDKNVVKKRSKN